MALVSVRRARLAVLERKGVKGATAARALSDDPQRFLPTVQVGITLISVLTGVFGGARIASHLQAWLETFPRVAAFAESLALAVVVIVTTYLTLVLGELVPKQLALRDAGTDGDRGLPRPIAVLSRMVGPAVWLLGKSSSGILRLFGLQPAVAPVRDGRGAQGAAGRGCADRRAGNGGARHDRARASPGRQAGARDHDAAHGTVLDRPHPSGQGDRRRAESRTALPLRGLRQIGR